MYLLCDNSGMRGHEHKLFKNDLDLIHIRKFSFSNRCIELTTCTVCKVCYY